MNPEKKYTEFQNQMRKASDNFYQHMNKIENWRSGGHEAINAVIEYSKNNAGVLYSYCNDTAHSSSIIVLVLIPYFGIRVHFLPQDMRSVNEMFLYEKHLDQLVFELGKAKVIFGNYQKKYFKLVSSLTNLCMDNKFKKNEKFIAEICKLIDDDEY